MSQNYALFFFFFFLPCLFYHAFSLAPPRSNPAEASPLNSLPSFSAGIWLYSSTIVEDVSLSPSLSLPECVWESRVRKKGKLRNHVLPNSLCCDWCDFKRVGDISLSSAATFHAVPWNMLLLLVHCSRKYPSVSFERPTCPKVQLVLIRPQNEM